MDQPEQRITFTPEAEALMRDLQNAPALVKAIAKAMGVQNKLTVAHVQRQHLTGQGPFPPGDHKLGVRSGRLLSAAFDSAPKISGTKVESAIGDSVIYAKAHEFGARIHRKARSGTVRLRTDQAGQLMRQAGFAHLAVFARTTSGYHHKRVKEVKFEAAAYDFDLPERSPFRTGISERLGAYGMALSQAVVEAWGKGGTKK